MFTTDRINCVANSVVFCAFNEDRRLNGYFMKLRTWSTTIKYHTEVTWLFFSVRLNILQYKQLTLNACIFAKTHLSAFLGTPFRYSGAFKFNTYGSSKFIHYLRFSVIMADLQRKFQILGHWNSRSISKCFRLKSCHTFYFPFPAGVLVPGQVLWGMSISSSWLQANVSANHMWPWSFRWNAWERSIW